MRLEQTVLKIDLGFIHSMINIPGCLTIAYNELNIGLTMYSF